MAPTFTVVIPVHNRSRMVRQAVDSVLAQDLDDFEIVVVDDGSTDDTIDHLQSYGARIRLLRQPNRGPEVARNEGAKAARGEYLCFLDSDDLLLPWALSTYHRIIESTAQPALLLGRMIHFSSPGPFPVDPGLRTPIEICVYPDILSKDRAAAYSFSVFLARKEALAAVGGFRRSTPQMFQGDDLDFLLRMGTSGPAVLIMGPKTVAYREHSGNSMQHFSELVEGFRANIGAERKGKFAGGKKRRMDRYSLIGGCLGYWLLTTVRAGSWKDALDLSAIGYPMLAARLLKTAKTRIRGRTKTVSLGRP